MDIVHISLVSIIGLLCLLFSAKVYRANEKNKVNISFALFGVVSALWMIFDFSVYQASLADHQTFLNRLDIANICVLIYSLAYFAHLFPRELFKLPKFIGVIATLATIGIVLLVMLTDKVVAYAFMEDYGSNIKFGSLFSVFALFTTTFTAFTLIVFIIKYFKFRELEKLQVRYILYGIGLLTIFNLTFNMFLPWATKSFIYGRFGTYSAVFFVGYTAYAILKAGAFNLKIIVTESAVIIINVLLIVQIFLSKTLAEGGVRTIVTGLTIYGSYILLRSVKLEIEQKKMLSDATEELKKANKKLAEADAMKTEFVSIASHELLTPISAIEGYLSMMLDEHMVRIDDPKAQKYMNNVYLSSRRLARLVSDLLNVSRIEQGRLLVQKADANVANLIQGVIDELKFKAQSSQVKLVSNIALQGANLATYIDADKIKEVLVNLCGNSFKFTPKGGQVMIGVELWPTARVSQAYAQTPSGAPEQPNGGNGGGSLEHVVDERVKTLVGDTQIVVSVADNGMGITPEDMKKLFHKFSRLDAVMVHSIPGTGLGLYISKALVELNHGRIWAESAGKDKGTVFRFTLPMYGAKTQITQIDAQLPQSKDAKPLSHMGEEENHKAV